jgi:hypothetical protein
MAPRLPLLGAKTNGAKHGEDHEPEVVELHADEHVGNATTGNEQHGGHEHVAHKDPKQEYRLPAGKRIDTQPSKNGRQ